MKLIIYGAGGGGRTHTNVTSRDFESFKVIYSYLFLTLNIAFLKAQNYEYSSIYN